jgi:SAM-dependent methyltransferase
MAFPLSKVANIADFKNEAFKSIFFKYNLNPQNLNNLQFLNRKTWEIAMAIYSFDYFNLLDNTKEFLGIGAGKEETISILSNYAKRVFATDIYLDQGGWSEWHDKQVLIDARPEMGERYNHRRVVWQHVNGCELPYEDNSFDGIFSCSSIEHFGNEKEIRQAIEEAYRVLKPGGIAAISSEYKILGEGDGFDNIQLFDRKRLERVWLDGLGWDALDFLDEKIDDTNFIDFNKYIVNNNYQKNAHPHIKLISKNYQWTSVHLTFQKKD